MPVIDAVLPQGCAGVHQPAVALPATGGLPGDEGQRPYGHHHRRFIERDLGSWTGKRWEDISRKEAKAFDANYLITGRRR